MCEFAHVVNIVEFFRHRASIEKISIVIPYVTVRYYVPSVPVKVSPVMFHTVILQRFQ